jgi:hypothetical protein
VLPCLSVIFLTWILRFPWTWFLYLSIALEIIVVFAIELDARKTPGNSGWIMMSAAVFQIYLGVLLMVFRLGIWVYYYIKQSS